MKTKNLVLSSMFLAMGILLPQAFHLVGVQNAGSVFSPMHIPVFIAGLVLGPVYGLFIGVATPFLSFLLTGMPGVKMVGFMMAELATYGLVSGLLYRTFKLSKNKLGVWIALIPSIICGRVMYGLALEVGAALFNVNMGTFTSIFASAVTGLPGIILQIILVPAVVMLLQNAKVIEK